MRKNICVSLLALAFLLSAAVLPLSAAAAAQPPSAPKLTVTQNAGYFSLSWSQPRSEEPILGYVCSYGLVSEGEAGRLPVNVDKQQLSADTPQLDAYGQLYEFTVYAVSAAGDGDVSDTVTATLLHQNDINVQKAKTAIEGTTFTATINEAGTADALKQWLQNQIVALKYNVTVSVSVSSFEPAELTKTGSFIFTASLSIGNTWEPHYANTVTAPIKGSISSSGKLSTPKIVIQSSGEGGIAYTITTTGPASQAEMIESFKVTVYNAVNDEVVVADYTVNAAEKIGVLGLGIGLKGETSYRLAVKACSNNTLKYLDSELSDTSVVAKAGRIPITVKPDIAEKLYGDTEPVFGYKIENGPDPLPTGVDLKLSFSRAEGEDIGTYAFTYVQTDTNYEVTVADTVFTIQKRPLEIIPATREVIFENGVTYLPNEVGEAVGLVEGDEITTLEFSSKDARGEVGEYEISAVRAVIMSGSKDVTKNYEITFSPGKLIVRPVGYSPQGSGGFPLWAVFVIIAAVLLILAGLLLFFILRRKKKKKGLPPDDNPSASPEDAPDGAAGETDAEQTPPAEAEAPARDPYQEYLEIIDMEALEEDAAAELEAEARESALTDADGAWMPDDAAFSEGDAAEDSPSLAEDLVADAPAEDAAEESHSLSEDLVADTLDDENAPQAFHSHPAKDDPLRREILDPDLLDDEEGFDEIEDENPPD